MSGQSAIVCGLWTLTAERPGPHVAITGLVHGDEPCGRVAIERLLACDLRPARGRLSLALVNPAAAAVGRRYLDRDMNRLWRDDWLDQDQVSVEAGRARRLRTWLATVDLHLDLHSTAFVPKPFFVLADMAKTRRLADAMGWPAAQQLMEGGCAEGRHLIDYGRFADPDDPATAVTVECGRHDDEVAGEIAYEAALRFLEVTGCVGDLAEVPAPDGRIERYRVQEPCIAQSDEFDLRIPLTGFVAVRAGEIVALDGGMPVAAPFDGYVLAPRPAPQAGSVAFYWCRELNEKGSGT